MDRQKSILSHLDDYLSLSHHSLNTSKALILGIIAARTVNLKEVCARFEHGIEASNYRKVQYFFQQQSINDCEVMRFIIDHLFACNEQFTLAIDRTDWSFGQTRHNLLIVSVLYKQTAIPLVTLSLEKKGNSNCDQRALLLDRILSALPRHRIKAIIGDREFMGEEWFKLLKERHLPFVMRIRSNIRVAKVSFVGPVSELPTVKCPVEHGRVHIGPRFLELSTTYSKDELVAVVSDNVQDPLTLYKQRWAIETGFKCLKSNGFNLEDTHLRHPDRIKTLVQICAIAMTLIFLTVKQANVKIPNFKKNMALS
ncbi:MAG: IS4 family transposase [Pseudomonadota bacterium]